MSDSRYAFLEPGRFARGWHIVAFSSELEPGAVQRLHYFGVDLVLFRGEYWSATVSLPCGTIPKVGRRRTTCPSSKSGATVKQGGATGVFTARVFVRSPAT